MDSLVDYLNEMDTISLCLIALPMGAIAVLCGYLLIKAYFDTMQRNSHQKHTHHNKSQKDAECGQNSHSGHAGDKNDSLNDKNQQSRRQRHRGSPKQRKSRGNSKRQDETVSTAGQKRALDDDWLADEMEYGYDDRYISAREKGKLGCRHNPEHRNSTSSEATGSDDLTISSSNEDLTNPPLDKGKKNRRGQHKRRGRNTRQQASQEDAQEERAEPNKQTEREIKQNQRPDARKQSGKSNFEKQRKQKPTNSKPVNKNLKQAANALISSNSNSLVSADSCADSSGASKSSSSVNSPHSSPTSSPSAAKRNSDSLKKLAEALTTPSFEVERKLPMPEQELVALLRPYIIDAHLLRIYGFPVESAVHEGCIEIYKCLPKPMSPTRGRLNVINSNDGLHAFQHQKQWALTEDNHNSGDSGQGSGEISPSSMDSDSSETGEEEPAATNAIYTPDGSYQIFSQYDQSLEKQCSRCKRAFHVTEKGEYLTREPCCYHWGKLHSIYTFNKGYAYQYSCCHGDEYNEGCASNYVHVWSGAVVGLNGPYTDFVHTIPRMRSKSEIKVFALDCEMSFTGRGLEATKITVVGYDGQLVYEHLILPEAEIVDYNTRFSGITEQDFADGANSVKSLPEVQCDLLQLFDADTVLIGHSLENDLRALRIVHKNVIDTSVVFPHCNGFPYRRALKHLTKLCLGRDIQNSVHGHNSYEDSRAALELMFWKLRNDFQMGYLE